MPAEPAVITVAALPQTHVLGDGRDPPLLSLSLSLSRAARDARLGSESDGSGSEAAAATETCDRPGSMPPATPARRLPGGRGHSRNVSATSFESISLGPPSLPEAAPLAAAVAAAGALPAPASAAAAVDAEEAVGLQRLRLNTLDLSDYHAENVKQVRPSFIDAPPSLHSDSACTTDGGRRGPAHLGLP